jgi:hypothetical protein
MIGSQLGQKVSKAPSKPIKKKLGVVAHTCHPSYMGNINRWVAVHIRLGLNTRPYLKNN